MRMIIDFIKSWLYYPKLKKYFENKGMIDYVPETRFEYAKWHSRCGKLKDNQYEPETEQDNSDGWTSIYDREPIEK